MDAKAFIDKKHEEAVAELKALEVEYLARVKDAQAIIDMTKKWLDELGTGEPPVQKPNVVASSAETWVSARDLTSPGR